MTTIVFCMFGFFFFFICWEGKPADSHPGILPPGEVLGSYRRGPVAHRLSRCANFHSGKRADAAGEGGGR